MNLLTLVENGEIYAPASLGKQSILVAGQQIAQIGTIDSKTLSKLDCDFIDAKGYLIIPGLIDPHTHIAGAGGEQGFGSRMPEIEFDALVLAGITTAVGLIGTDVTGRTMFDLLAKAQKLKTQGIACFIYTGGFPVPPATITESVQSDIVRVERVIGLGELAISDERSSNPSLHELARLVSQAYTGGLISGKAGVTHFHTGEGKAKLSMLHALLDEHNIPPHVLYPGHVSRTKDLMEDAIKLAKRGAFVDMDTVDENAVEWLPYYLEHGGVPERVTVSSDAHTPGGTPEKFYTQFIECVRVLGMERALPCFTSNTATVLKLPYKGRIEKGRDADFLIVKPDTYEIVHVFAQGRQVVRDGKAIPQSPPPEESGH